MRCPTDSTTKSRGSVAKSMHEVYPKPGDQSWKPGRGQILWQTSQIALDDTHGGKAPGKVGWDQNRIVSRHFAKGVTWPGTPRTDERCSRGCDQRRHLHLWRRRPSFIDGGCNDRHWMFDTRSASPRWEPETAPPLTVHGADGAVPRLDGHGWRLNPGRSPLAHRLVERAAADEAKGAPKINSSGGSEGYSPLCISSWTGCAPFVI